MYKIYLLCLIVVIFVVSKVMAIEIVSRAEWGARPPKYRIPINQKVPFVVIHHSYTPAACFTSEGCKSAMRSMQKFHQEDRGWADIGYTFGIGGDGEIYEGRGFNVVGAHAPKFNDKSIGICIIGDWQEKLPPENMLAATQSLIAHAIDTGYLSTNYTLLGHRQVRDTVCPGDRLFKEISQWPNFSAAVPERDNENEIP